jgi:hypothetical protein
VTFVIARMLISGHFLTLGVEVGLSLVLVRFDCFLSPVQQVRNFNESTFF